jgi:hypothetical protein
MLKRMPCLKREGARWEVKGRRSEHHREKNPGRK